MVNEYAATAYKTPSFFLATNEPAISNEAVTVLAGNGADRTLEAGTVLGKRTLGAATYTADAGNTGDFTASAVALSKGAVVGDYRVVFISATTFEVYDPNGNYVGLGALGAAFAKGGLSFTLTAGGTAAVAGDAATIAVAAGDGKVVQLDLAGTSGEADAYGVLYDTVTAPDGVDADGVAVVRQAALKDAGLIWPAGITADQKTAALAELAANTMIVRDAA